MSKKKAGAEAVAYVFGYILFLAVVAAAILSGLAFVIGWLAPIATAGAFAPNFIQSLGIVTLLSLVAGIFKR